jgi:hypothetical protein
MELQKMEHSAMRDRENPGSVEGLMWVAVILLGLMLLSVTLGLTTSIEPAAFNIP